MAGHHFPIRCLGPRDDNDHLRIGRISSILSRFVDLLKRRKSTEVMRALAVGKEPPKLTPITFLGESSQVFYLMNKANQALELLSGVAKILSCITSPSLLG